MMAASIFPPKTENIATAKTFHSTTVVDPGEAPPLLLDKTEARRAEKNFLDTLSQGLDPALYTNLQRSYSELSK